jgi:hypothetical protein
MEQMEQQTTMGAKSRGQQGLEEQENQEEEQQQLALFKVKAVNEEKE